MNKEKQTEEITEILANGCKLGGCEECKYSEGGYPECSLKYTADKLYTAGYRKATDFAEEIFADIEEMLNMQAIIVCKTRETVMKADEPPLSYMAMLDGRIYSIRVVEEHIAELKKKYTQDKGRDKIAEFGKYSSLSWRNT